MSLKEHEMAVICAETYTLVVVNVAGASTPLTATDGGELGGDVASKAGVHGDVELPSSSCSIDEKSILKHGIHWDDGAETTFKVRKCLFEFV